MGVHTFDFNAVNIIRRYGRKVLNTVLSIRYKFYDFDIPIIMVTGTDGKSTTVGMITTLLKLSGKKVASFSTVEFYIGDEVLPNTHKKTTSNVQDLAVLLDKAKKSKCDIVVLEVSSHSIWYHRIFGLVPTISVFTNISREHLDFHGTIGNYATVKSYIFHNTKLGNVINIADEYSYMFASQDKKNIGYCLSDEKLKYFKDGMLVLKGHILSDKMEDDGVLFDLETIDNNEKKDFMPFQLSVHGDFNVENALAVIGVAKLLNIDDITVKYALERFKGIKGRMEKIYDKDFKVFIDFTVTPKSYDIVLSNLKSTLSGGRLLVLMGSCGDRDMDKRPKIGDIASRYADVIILTNEDPYTEDPYQILDMIENGIDKDKKKKIESDILDKNSKDVYSCIIDREEAIQKMISIADKGDILLFAGKGGETKMMIGTKAIDWDEEAIIKKYL